MNENREQVIKVLGRFRYLCNQLWSNPDILIRDIGDMPSYGDMIYPCDVVELRGILKDLSIKDRESIPFFSIKFAEKYLKRFSVFLVVSNKNLCYDCKDCTGLRIYPIKSMDIGDSLKRVIINDPISPEAKKAIFEMVSEIGQNVECSVSNSIPGISSINPKLSANNIHNEKK